MPRVAFSRANANARRHIARQSQLERARVRQQQCHPRAPRVQPQQRAIEEGRVHAAIGERAKHADAAQRALLAHTHAVRDGGGQ